MKDGCPEPNLQDFLDGRYWAGGGPVTRALSQRVGAVLAWLAARVGGTPSQLTVIGLLLSLTASAVYANSPSGWVAAVGCLLLYQLAYGADCADGQLARATGRSSEFGAWLDLSCDCVSVLALSFAVAYLCLQGGLAPAPVLGAVFIFTVGRVLSLYSSKAVGASAVARNRRAGWMRGALKALLWFPIDTPVLLAVICVLRDRPVALLGYAAFIGGAQTLQTAWLGWRLGMVPR